MDNKEGNNDASPGCCDSRATEKVKDFMDTTSAHGWGNAVRSSHASLRTLWIVLTLAALGCNMVHVAALIAQYLKYPYEQVTLVRHDEVPFPSVTVCSIQPVSLSSMYSKLADPRAKISHWSHITSSYFKRIDYDENDGEARYLFERMTGPRGFYENIGEEVLEIGHDPQDLIISCLYNSEGCSWQNFTLSQSATYYNCYTFNGGNRTQEKMSAKTTGPQSGLSLVLYLENDNGDDKQKLPYYTFMNTGNAAGVRVVIHSQDTYASPVDKGFDIPPGFSSSVGIDITRHTRLGDPYSVCKDAKSNPDDETYKYAYSDHECTLACQQELVMSECRCMSADLPHAILMNGSLNFCSKLNLSEPNPLDILNRTNCEQLTRERFVKSHEAKENCSCTAACDEFQYLTDVSYSYWPIQTTQRHFFNHYIARNPIRDQLKAWRNLKTFNESYALQRDLIRMNFARLNVYFKSLVIQEYKQQASYQFFNLFSDIGGTFGLWIGMSLLTWGEVIELLFVICYRSLNSAIKGEKA